MPPIKRKALCEAGPQSKKMAKKHDAPPARLDPLHRTRASKGPSAAIRALVLPELLEQIHLHSSLHDLFVWQRVSRTWQAAIKSSPTVQQKMFLRGEGDIIEPTMSTKPGLWSGNIPREVPTYEIGEVRLNPILPLRLLHHDREPAGGSTFPFGLSVVFCGGCSRPPVHLYLVDHSMLAGLFPRRGPTQEQEISMARYTRPEASWRNMLFTQRPVQGIRVYDHDGDNWDDEREEYLLTGSGSGVTLGDIDDNLKKAKGPLNLVLTTDNVEEMVGIAGCKGKKEARCGCLRLLLV